jgi:hypothetical protein
MGQTWTTQYGTRRVKNPPPTLDEAIFAAQGLTDDLDEQAEVAASLMELPLEDVKARIMQRATRGARPSSFVSTGRKSPRTVVVERRVITRPSKERRFGF